MDYIRFSGFNSSALLEIILFLFTGVHPDTPLNPITQLVCACAGGSTWSSKQSLVKMQQAQVAHELRVEATGVAIKEENREFSGINSAFLNSGRLSNHSNIMGTENNKDSNNTPEYLAQLLKDKKQIAAFPNVFIHTERLLDDGESNFPLHFVILRLSS